MLKKLAGVSNGAWNGNLSVTVDGATYTVAEDVVCYNRTAGVFMSLSAAKAQAGSANLYCDGAGNRIRIVEVS